MQKFKSWVSNMKDRIVDTWDAVADWFSARKDLFAAIVNVLTIAVFTIGVIALLILVWLYVRPIKTAEIKVPVATDQASYSPGEEISGIFFGDTYYSGNVKILREVFCKDYKGVIKPPAESAEGDLFSTIGKPRHLEGQSLLVGNLPKDIPVGANCVLQFSNNYYIQTPFGVRHIEYQYYTQNFSIVTAARRAQLDCEAAGRMDCNQLRDANGGETEQQSADNQSTSGTQTSPETQQPSSSSSTVNNSTTNNTTNNSTTNNPPAEPAPSFHEECTVNLLGIKVGCRQVQDN